jgi:four helix bundle protein
VNSGKYSANSTQQTVQGVKRAVRSAKLYSYTDLFAWKKSDLLAHEVYRVTLKFPQSELFGLTSQLRRAALSVPTNIVEGFGRLNKNEFRHFLSISFASLSEVQYLVDFSYKQKLIEEEDYARLILLREECGKLVWKLYVSQK